VVGGGNARLAGAPHNNLQLYWLSIEFDGEFGWGGTTVKR